MIQKLFTEQFIKFALAGGSAAFVAMVSRYFLSFYFLFEISVVVSYLLGMTFAFSVMRWCVFEKESDSIGKAYLRFSAVNAVSAVIVLVVSVVFARLIFPLINYHFYADTVAHFIGVSSPIMVSYHAHMKYSFR